MWSLRPGWMPRGGWSWENALRRSRRRPSRRPGRCHGRSRRRRRARRPALTVDAASAGGWRPDTTPAWWTDQPSQGYCLPVTGYQGAWFYGSSAFASIAGRSCTSLTLRVSRPSVGGISGRHLWRAAAPQRHEASVRAVLALDRREGVRGPAWGGTTTITLPTSWGQALIDGTARGRPVPTRGPASTRNSTTWRLTRSAAASTLGWG